MDGNLITFLRFPGDIALLANKEYDLESSTGRNG